ncbi:phospholipid carrier-dependent glycosyltransferase [Aurantiacibacter spongiae]|uniref:Polyprenol-phosphate-mannose--protein mannosyltransferase n=1 Tax=Aurantiacibacter spongiae TaxID=2488860 RepID=A0A3N5D832_9SPHN|nr:phospholipid carrier-dependent glycosyltransferase [Aurantiacibacter spongiae]RPF70738.1 phospholipid carrier-dependent glycosyltransferase [Aurantiacibacter spongiae]
MSTAPVHPRDPFGWNCVVALAFVLLASVRLTTPGAPFFDEVHYLPAARTFLTLGSAENLEHPPLGKELIALGISLFGDGPLGWRIMSLAFGTLALLAAMRAMWLASGTRTASVLTGVFVATNFLLFVHARIAMLDIFMVSFTMLALWMCAGALRENETARWRLAIAGVALGCAMASKWNAVPVAVLPGLAFAAVRLSARRRRPVRSVRGAPVGGMSLAEAAIWLGAVPLAVYALTFAPYLWFDRLPGDPVGMISLHMEMLGLQEQVPEPHPYQSNWPQWVANWRAIWYLYENVDGAMRGVMLIGNPVTMLAGLPALAWCAWSGWKERRRDCAAVAILYAASLALWVVAPKAVQFYFHYFLPGMFLSAALALGCDRLMRRGRLIGPGLVVLGAVAAFAYWYPILTAAPLENGQAFLRWAWLTSWR